MMRFKRIIALVLAVSLLVTTFAGCGQNDEENAKKEVTAAAVTFSRAGQYTTTVTEDGVDFSGVTAENTEITCYNVETTTLEEAEENEKADDSKAKDNKKADDSEAKKNKKADDSEAGKAEENEEANDSALNNTARLDSVKVNGNTVEITFTDAKAAAEPLKDNYYVIFRNINKKYDIPVKYPKMTLTCNVNNVKAAAAGAKLELTLKGGTFAESFSSKDIKLANAFSKMKVSKAVASGNKLTLELKGKPTKNKQINAMEWGTVVVKSSGIADGYTDVSAAVDVEKEYSGFDAESLKYAKGKVTADIYSYGGKDPLSDWRVLSCHGGDS